MVRIALVHDYLTQRGGAERVVLSMHRAFPDAPIYTSLYEPLATFPEFSTADVRPSRLNRSRIVREHHRLALPVLPFVFGRMEVDADVVLCSSSGWAHGVRATGKKLVYFYTPARWLYQTQRYLGERSSVLAAPVYALRPALRKWDRTAARTTDVALTLSRVVVERLKLQYGIDAELLPPPPGIRPDGPYEQVHGLQGGFWLCVSRLLPYKNVGSVVEAFGGLPHERLVVVGAGPELSRLVSAAEDNVRFLNGVTDAQLRWLYRESIANVSASFEDYGLTPLEAASFGKPSAVLKWGGFLDTVIEGVTGSFFDSPDPESIRRAVIRVRRCSWQTSALTGHAHRYNEEQFIARLREIVAGLTG